MKMQVLVHYPDGDTRAFAVNPVAEAERMCARFKAQGLHAVVAPVYPDKDDIDDFNY